MNEGEFGFEVLRFWTSTTLFGAWAVSRFFAGRQCRFPCEGFRGKLHGCYVQVHQDCLKELQGDLICPRIESEVREPGSRKCLEMGVAYKKSRVCNWIWCMITIAVIAAVVVVAVVIIKNKKRSSSGDQTPGSSFTGNYTESMRLALTFLDIQKCKQLILLACFPARWC